MSQESKKSPLFRLNVRYLLMFLGLFITEVAIAKFLSGGFIRPFLGDAIVVVLMYSFVRAFLVRKPLYIAMGCLAFACAIETLQAFHLGERLGLSGIWLIVLGSIFDPLDILAYVIGFVVCVALGGKGELRGCILAIPKHF